MRNSRSRTAYLLEASLVRIMFQHDRSYLWTLTNAEPITDIAKVKRMSRALQDWIRRKGGTCAGVWEPQPKRSQKLGAPVWHLHFITNLFIPVNWLRPWLKARGWGNIDVQRVDENKRCQATRGNPVLRTADLARANYLTKYLRKPITATPKHKPLVWYVNRAKCGTIRFNWSGGMARAWRLGLQSYITMMAPPGQPPRYSSFGQERSRRKRLQDQDGNPHVKALIHHVLRLGLAIMGQEIPDHLQPSITSDDLRPFPLARAGPSPQGTLPFPTCPLS